VMPTLVATMAAPTNTAFPRSVSAELHIHKGPGQKGTITPPTATCSALLPTRIKSLGLVSRPALNSTKDGAQLRHRLQGVAG